MRDYGKVSPQFWTGETGRELRKLGRDAQLMALFLVTGPTANMIGIYHLPLSVAASYLGMTTEGASKALRRVQETGFCRFEGVSEWVFVPEMASQQIGEPLQANDNRVKAIHKELLSLRKSVFYKDFYARYKHSYHLEKLSPFEAPSKPLRSQEQEQEQEQEKEQEQKKKTSPAAPDGFFEQFWKAFPAKRRTKKGKARAAWKQAIKKASPEVIIAAAVEYANSPTGRGDYVQGPEPWLNGECWDDDRQAWGNSDPTPTDEDLLNYNGIDGGLSNG